VSVLSSSSDVLPGGPPATRRIAAGAKPRFSERRRAALISCAVFLVHAFSPALTSADSRWTVMVALSIIDRHTTNLDPYIRLIKEKQYLSVECAGPSGELLGPQIRDCAQGHLYNLYPVGTPLMAAPFVWAMRSLLAALALLLGRQISLHHPVLDAFFHADLVNAYPLVESVIASVFVALTAQVLFFTARRHVDARSAAAMALIFAFATSAWSTASRALFQHGPSMLLIATVLYLLVSSEDNPQLAGLAGLPVAFAYVVRPTNALLVAVITAYVLVRHTRQFLLYALCALPVAVGFIAYNVSAFGRMLPYYYSQRPPLPHSTAEVATVLKVMAGQLISPSRGLLIFTPIAAFSIVGMFRSWRSGWTPLSKWLIALVILHWITISMFVSSWWGGHSYGPRLFSDMAPVLVLFLTPLFQQWQDQGGWNWRPSQCAFVALLAISVFMHGQGGLNIRAHMWNITPADVDQRPARVWDWKDPQFLRGL